MYPFPAILLVRPQAMAELLYIISVYIYILVCSCAYPCTEKVNLMLKWILQWSWSGPKFASQFISQFLSQVWSQLWLRCAGEAIAAYLALSKVCRGSYRGVPGTIQGWKAITLSKGGKLKLSQGAPRSAKLNQVRQVSQVGQVEPGPPSQPSWASWASWAAMVGSLSKFLYRYITKF